jgi:hypothetical protein
MQMHYPAARKMCSLRSTMKLAGATIGSAPKATLPRQAILPDCLRMLLYLGWHGITPPCLPDAQTADVISWRLTGTDRNTHHIENWYYFPSVGCFGKCDNAAITGKFDDSVGSIWSPRSARNRARARSSSDPGKSAMSDHIRRRIRGEFPGHDASSAIGAWP